MVRNFERFGGAWTIVAANDEAAIEKAAASRAAAIALDLEDLVPPSQKPKARTMAVESLRKMQFSMPVMVRLNGLDTEHCEADLQELIPAIPMAIMLPKVEHPDQAATLVRRVTEIEAEHGVASGSIECFFLIETAAAVLRLDAICAAAKPRLAGLHFGAEDFMAELGVRATPVGTEVAFARGAIVIACKAYGLVATDRAWLDLDDLAGYRQDTEIARSMGFDGRCALSQGQIDIANEMFAPTEDEVASAGAVIAAMEEAEATGRGSVVVDGGFVDVAAQRRARAIVARGNPTLTNGT